MSTICARQLADMDTKIDGKDEIVVAPVAAAVEKEGEVCLLLLLL